MAVRSAKVCKKSVYEDVVTISERRGRGLYSSRRGWKRGGHGASLDEWDR